MLPSAAICEQARCARDARFDGIFFTAVKTTGIYCRPVCPVPPARAANVLYFANAASAEAAGFRPCLRCRPELAPADGHWRRGDALLARALRMIEGGALDEAPLASLAERLHVGERHLRRVFQTALGVSPQQVQATRRLLFAKQLLSETTLPITEVAQAAGFGSQRRFNDAWIKAYDLPPSRLRRQSGNAPAARPSSGSLQLRLNYRPPFDFRATLAFLRIRALPGIEQITQTSYSRVLDLQGAWLQLEEWGAGEAALRLHLHGVAAPALPSIVQQLRQMFDLDADPCTINAHLAQDPALKPLLQAHPGLRLPGAWNVFETAVRAVLGQQVSVAAASTLTQRLLARLGQPLVGHAAPGLHQLFPAPAQLANANLVELGITTARIRSLHAIGHALSSPGGHILDGQHCPALDDFLRAWTALPGIGPWSAEYIALRGLHHPDAFPAGDLVLRKQLGMGQPLPENVLRQRAEAWRPWRAYAAIHLWHAAAHT